MWEEQRALRKNPVPGSADSCATKLRSFADLTLLGPLGGRLKC